MHATEISFKAEIVDAVEVALFAVEYQKFRESSGLQRRLNGRVTHEVRLIMDSEQSGPSIPSLQRLLSLEKTFSTFGEQVQELAYITGFSSQIDSGNVTNPSRPSEDHETSYARNEFAVRWLLQRLHGDDAKSQEARSYAPTWKLMTALVDNLPVSTAANLLKAGKTLPTITKALEDSVNLTTGDDSASPPSKKRRRDGSPVETSAAPGASNVQASVDLFYAVAGFLVILVDIATSRNRQQAAIECEYMKSVLRCDAPQAAKLLKFHFTALRKSFNWGSQVQAAQFESQLSSALYVWRLRSRTNADSSRTDASLFSSECLAHTLTLLKASAERSLPGEKWKQVVRLLEQLIVSHILAPARSSHFRESKATYQRVKANSKTTSREEPDDNTIHLLLAPLRGQLLQLADRNTGSPNDEWRALIRAIPSLFDIAVRATSRTTPKKRLKEDAWLQHVFLELADLTSTILEKTKTDPMSTPDVRSLEPLLEVVKKHDVKMQRSLLERLMKDHTSLTASPNQGQDNCRWTLIAAVMDVDANAFVGRQNGTEELSDILLNHVSNFVFSGGNPMFHHVVAGQKIVHALLQPSWPAFKEAVVLPLINAYAEARMLDVFITRWYEMMERLSQKDNSDPMELDGEQQNLPAPYSRDPLSFWEDEDIATALRGVAESSMTAKQISTLLKTYFEKIDEICGLEPLEVEELRPLVVVLDVLLRCIHRSETVDELKAVDELDAVEEAQKSFFEGFSTLVLNFFPEIEQSGLSARFWRILTQLHLLMAPRRDWEDRMTDFVNYQGPLPMDRAIEQITYFASHPEPKAHVAAFEAFHFVATMCDISYHSIAHGQLGHLLERALAEALNPRSETFHGFLGDAATVFIRHAQLLPLLPHAALLKLFTQWVDNAFREAAAPDKELLFTIHGTSAQTLLEGLIDALSNEASSAVQELVETVLSKLERQAKECLFDRRNLSDQQRTFPARMLLKIPVTMVSRKHRERILNCLCHIFSSQKNVEKSVASLDELALAAKLMTIPNATAKISTDPDNLRIILEVVAVDVKGDLEARLAAVNISLELCKRTLGHLIATKTQDRSQELLSSVRDGLVELQDNFFESEGPLALTIGELQEMRAFLPTLIDGGVFDTSRSAQNILEKYLKALLLTMENRKWNADGKVEQRERDTEKVLLYSCLEALVAIPKIKHGNALAEKLVERALQWGGHHDNENPSPVARWLKTDGTRQWALLLRIICCAISREDCLAFVLDFEHVALDPREEEAMLKDINEALQRTDDSAKHDMAKRLKLADGFSPSIRHVQLTNLLVSSLERMPGTEKVHLEPFDSILPQYCNYFLQASSSQVLHLLFDGTNIILRDKPWLVTQWSVDSLLASLTILSSSNSPAFPTSQAGAIYTRICETTYSLLLLHRTRLSGRYHLLMPLLQNLLRCLFLPDTRSSNKDNNTLNRPSWLPTTTRHLHAKHATSYTRLLTSLCSPTISSVTRHTHGKTHNELIDTTKKAKSYAGQYVSATLEEYCVSQLRGRINSEMKAALMPGLYACMDVMSVEAMRAMNAGMDNSASAIWQSVYRDWTVRGKWRGG